MALDNTILRWLTASRCRPKTIALSGRDVEKQVLAWHLNICGGCDPRKRVCVVDLGVRRHAYMHIWCSAEHVGDCGCKLEGRKRPQKNNVIVLF